MFDGYERGQAGNRGRARTCDGANRRISRAARRAGMGWRGNEENNAGGGSSVRPKRRQPRKRPDFLRGTPYTDVERKAERNADHRAWRGLERQISSEHQNPSLEGMGKRERKLVWFINGPTQRKDSPTTDKRVLLHWECRFNMERTKNEFLGTRKTA
jgi:hypothetical protein